MIRKFEKEQPIAFKILSNSINNNKISHAYLFETNGYSQGLNMAISFAKTLLCPNHHFDNEKCADCKQCLKIDENNFTELKIINPDGLWIKKEQLTELQEEFNKKSIQGNNKVYIINQADRLNINAANTILKFIEEPPIGIIAILVVENVYQLIDTIVSRCQIISLNNNLAKMKNFNTVEKIVKILDVSDEEMISIKDKIDSIVKFITYYEQKGKKILLHLNKYWFSSFSNKIDMIKAIQIIVLFYKDCLYKKMGENIEIFGDYEDSIENIVKSNTISQLAKKIKVYNDNNYYLNNNANLNLLMDKIIIELEEGDVNEKNSCSFI